jgi:adenylosuccinate lyase
MIQRYSRAAMREIWSEQRKLEIWLQIELLAAEALSARGLVPAADMKQMKERAAFSIERCRELERTLNHDVIAFTTNVAENIGAPANRWFHFGLTSSDIIDTAFAVQMVQSADILIQDVEELRKVIAAKANQHQLTPMIGRSHGIHAEPTTFGLKMALMHDEFGRALKRLRAARETVAVGKLSGAVGTSAHLSPEIEAEVCKKLGLQPAPIATQVIQRDLHAEFMSTLALVGASIERWSTEFRHLQRTEVLEAEEYFAKGQKGSSALWHERDISHSSVERIIFPDSCTLLDYMLATLTKLVEGLVIYPENMKRNLKLSLGMWNSQTVLLALIKKGLTREEAYELVQRNAMKTWEVKHAGRDDADFVEQLKSDPEVAKHFKPGELEELCSLDFHFKEVKNRFKKLGLSTK